MGWLKRLFRRNKRLCAFIHPDAEGRYRIKICRLRGPSSAVWDTLFVSSIEDTYASPADADRVLDEIRFPGERSRRI